MIRVQFKRNHPFFKAMGFSVTMVLISIAIHSSTDFNLQIFANAATFVCILAMPWLAMHLPRANPDSGKLQRKRLTSSLLPIQPAAMP